jgi:hypothetical protein
MTIPQALMLCWLIGSLVLVPNGTYRDTIAFRLIYVLMLAGLLWWGGFWR